jgi:hypothetical protein
MFYSGVGLNIGYRTYNEGIMRLNPDVLAGICLFKESGIYPISLGGIAVDSAAPKVTAVISYKLSYMHNGSAGVLKIALAEGFFIRTILGAPFQRKAGLTYTPHTNQVVRNLWGVMFPVSFKTSEPTVTPLPRPRT